MAGIEEEIKSKKFNCNYEKAYVNFLYTYNIIKSNLKSCTASFGLTPQQYNVLRILRGQYPNSITPGKIKEVMLDKSPDLTRLLDRLEKQALVDRNLCSKNRRQMDVQITDKGLAMLEEIQPSLDTKLLERFRKLSDADAMELNRLLDELRG